MDLNKRKTIVVTGTSSGIGLELVKNLLDRDHIVYALSRRTDPLLNLQKNHLYADRLHIKSFDLISGNYEELKVWLNYTPVDVLINNAGTLFNKPFLELKEEEIKKTYETNIFGVIKTIQALFDNVRQSKGNITNITSIGGVNYSSKFSGLSAYSSSKGALNVLTECLAEEFKEYDINVNALALGAVATPMLKKAFPNYKPSVTAKQMANYIAEFTLSKAFLFNGKILPVANSTP